jgi:uncharacterized protein YwqG
MLLLCQVDLSELGGQLGPQFPNSGGLMFFVAVDDENEPLQDDSFNPVATRVIWVPELTDAACAAEDAPSLEPLAVKLEPDLTNLPQADAAIVLKELLGDEDREGYRGYMEERQPDGPTGGHRLGGYPCNVQSNSLEAQAEALLSGDEPNKDREGWSTAAKWRLLLQLDSDDAFMWGTDMGMLYFMIHEDDLAAHKFSRVISLAEGH